jgi:predicted nucleic acid-binding protein
VTFLLDTNVVSELRKKRPDPRVTDWFDSVAESELFISVLVVGEIRRGIARVADRDPAQAAVIDKWLARLTAAYGDRIVPITREVAEVWGPLNVPDPRPAIDGLIAATALAYGFTLVTRNVDDVSATGVSLLNPFADGR